MRRIRTGARSGSPILRLRFIGARNLTLTITNTINIIITIIIIIIITITFTATATTTQVETAEDDGGGGGGAPGRRRGSLRRHMMFMFGLNDTTNQLQSLVYFPILPQSVHMEVSTAHGLRLANAYSPVCRGIYLCLDEFVAFTVAFMSCLLLQLEWPLPRKNNMNKQKQ